MACLPTSLPACQQMHITRAYLLAADMEPGQDLQARLASCLGEALVVAFAGAQLHASFHCLVRGRKGVGCTGHWLRGGVRGYLL